MFKGKIPYVVFGTLIVVGVAMLIISIMMMIQGG